MLCYLINHHDSIPYYLHTVCHDDVFIMIILHVIFIYYLFSKYSIRYLITVNTIYYKRIYYSFVGASMPLYFTIPNAACYDDERVLFCFCFTVLF